MRFKRKNKLPTGSAAPKSNRTKWKLYRLMSFLDNVLQERSSIGSVGSESSQNWTEESAQDNIQEETDTMHSEVNIEQENAIMNTERDMAAPSTSADRQTRIINKRPRSNRNEIVSYMRERERNLDIRC